MSIKLSAKGQLVANTEPMDASSTCVMVKVLKGLYNELQLHFLSHICLTLLVMFRVGLSVGGMLFLNNILAPLTGQCIYELL